MLIALLESSSEFNGGYSLVFGNVILFKNFLLLKSKDFG
jgi:hypothetical protein